MAIKTFEGPEAYSESVDACLSWNYSALIVKDAIAHLGEFREAFDSGKELTTGVLARHLPLEDATQSLNNWAKENKFDGVNYAFGFLITGKTLPHVDDAGPSRPFGLSIGIEKIGHWATQPTIKQFDGVDERFDCSRPIDEFDQGPGDLVLIPRYTIHKVDAGRRRKSRIYTTHGFHSYRSK